MPPVGPRPILIPMANRLIITTGPIKNKPAIRLIITAGKITYNPKKILI